MAELAGLILAERYQLLDELGRGSSGAVYRARDLQLERDVAVKCVMPTAAVDAQTRARFLREGQLIARLDHPAIVPIHDAGDQDGLLYFVMPLVDGKTLRHYLREDQPTVDTLLEIAVQIGEALHYAHDRGVVHRDVKPENILVVGGVGGDVRARLMDFGLARAGFDSQLTQLTEVGAVVGTVAYLSPEQVVDSTRADGRCDLYALGVVLFEALCGALPFDGDVHAILYRIVHETPAPVCSRNPAIDRELGKLIDACMVKDAAARLSLREFLAGLARYRNSVDRRRLEFRPADKVVAGTAPRPASPFVGREAELNELRGRFETVSHGEPALVLVTGEPGTGKSALLEELRRIGAELGFVVLTGRCADAAPRASARQLRLSSRMWPKIWSGCFRHWPT
jgi:serine/threonine-protein kinase